MNNATDLFEDKTYKACRKAGMTAIESLERAKHVNHIKFQMAHWDQGESKHWELGNEEVWFIEEQGGRFEVHCTRDQDASLEDSDCYTPDAIAAYNAEEWSFWSVQAVFEHSDGKRYGYGQISSVDAGDYFKTDVYPLDEWEQMFAVAIDYYKIHMDAYADAMEKGESVKADEQAKHAPTIVDWTPVRHPSWDEDESLEYDPMNVVGVAGFKWVYNEDECQHVFSRGEGDDERHMLGEVIPGGLNMMLGGSFFNPIRIVDHATAESFLAAFTAKWEELVSDHYDED